MKMFYVFFLLKRKFKIAMAKVNMLMASNNREEY